MKAIVHDRYGSPDVLELRNVEIPIIGHDEVLVQVCASSVNSWDLEFLRGKPWINRVGAVREPKHPILGADVAGRVEAVGSNVGRFKPGDEVFGDVSSCGWGGFAEYVSADQAALAMKPVELTFDEAAAVPQAGGLAFQGLRKHGDIAFGDKVLVGGAGGGVGTFAVQIAKSFGAEVTAVDHTDKLEMLRSVGADHVIDYTRDDFTANGRQYDLILDVTAVHSIFDCRRSLAPNGSYVVVGGTSARVVQSLVVGPLISAIGNKTLGTLLHRPKGADLVPLIDFFEAGTVVPIIDRRYPLDQVPEALRHFAEGTVQGKLVITI